MRRERGFSLIELMIVVLIISILATVALNSYRKYVIRANRTDAKSAMQDLAGREERFMYKNNTYTAGSAALNITTSFGGPNYQVTVASASTTAYVVQGAPLGKQLSDDKECGTMQLSSNGVVTITGTGTVANCWGR
jgi:type IV pilus assembly protein PilE